MSASGLKEAVELQGLISSLIPLQDLGRFPIRTKMESQQFEATLSKILTGHIYDS